MRSDPLLRVLFVIYCLEAGLFLVLSPWTGSWGRLGALLPWGALREIVLATWYRGLIASFGVVHLLWALHDLDLLLRRRGDDADAARP